MTLAKDSKQAKPKFTWRIFFPSPIINRKPYYRLNPNQR